jgi:4-amino-4-deoxy-L-arabinose transferase-like glycosyltransferase
MPGYGVPYLLLRVFLSPAGSSDALVLLQLFLAGIACYLLALIARRCTRSDAAFFAVFAIALLSAFTGRYDVLLVTESFATSALILHLYLLLRWHDKGGPAPSWRHC